MPLIDGHIHLALSQTPRRAYTLSKNSWSVYVLELARGRRLRISAPKMGVRNCRHPGRMAELNEIASLAA